MNLTPGKYEQALAYLTINCSFLGDLSLFHGRMGIILFFAHYARATQSKHYEDFAGCLLDELYEEIHEDLPVNSRGDFGKNIARYDYCIWSRPKKAFIGWNQLIPWMTEFGEEILRNKRSIITSLYQIKK